MAQDFSALHSSLARTVTLQALWDTETIVARRERHHPQRRELQRTFEPRRRSLAGLAQAYAQVVAMIRRTTSRTWRHPGEDAEELCRRAPQGPSPCVGRSQHQG